jgi:hypothetical protein
MAARNVPNRCTANAHVRTSSSENETRETLLATTPSSNTRLYPTGVARPSRYSGCISCTIRIRNKPPEKSKPLKVGISLRTDEPRWALQIMQWLTVAGGTPLAKYFDKNLIEISYDNKAKHFMSLSRKTGIPFEDMVFFDNEYSNIQSDASLGVKCYFTPDGMTEDA